MCSACVLPLRVRAGSGATIMAGDWIKIRMDLHRHPKVVRIVSALNADKKRTKSGQVSASCPQDVREVSDCLRTVGGLHAVWCLFDQYSEDGKLPAYTPEILDGMIGWPGFSAALIDVGWLVYDGQGLVMPRFTEHNGRSAKRRATESERKRNERDSCPQNVRMRCGQNADQRREEKSNTPTVPKGDDAALLAIYEAYPRKTGRNAALRAIAKSAQQRSPLELLEAVRAYADATAQWPDEDRQYIPHPATWFNQGRYLDDRATWARGGTTEDEGPRVRRVML